MKQIVLASASPRRSELLKQIGITFKVSPANVDETIDLSMTPQELVQSLAYKKAISVARELGDGYVVIGADTIVVKGKVLGKPESESHAFNMLKALQNDWHDVVTGVVLIDSGSLKELQAFERTRVKMRPLTDDELQSYIKTGEPIDKAGAYGIQGMGALLVEKIEGCYFNVVGLPLTRLSLMLKEFGINTL